MTDASGGSPTIGRPIRRISHLWWRHKPMCLVRVRPLGYGDCHRLRWHLGAHATSIGGRVWFGWPRRQCPADAHGGWRYPDCTCTPLGYGEFRRGRFEVLP